MAIPSITLDTIVVTSNPLLPQTNEMATATSIITGDTLDSQVNSTLGDALENEIGVSTDSFGQGASRPIIRGQSAPRVQVMQNGLTVQDASQISPDHQISVPVLGARQIEVIKAFSHTDEETIYQESALFKVASTLLFDERNIQNIIKESNAQIVTVSREYFVLAKSGRRNEIDEMYQQLKPYGIMQFVRSGRIAVSKAEMQISAILKEFNQ